MFVTAFVVEQGATAVPALVGELPARVFHVPDNQPDAVDLVVAALLERGLSLVTRLRNPVRPAIGWAAVVAGDGADARLEVTTAAGEPFYSGTAHLPDGWTAAARELGWCLLYSGAVQLPDRDVNDPDAGLRALRAAAGAGKLVAGRITVALQASS